MKENKKVDELIFNDNDEDLLKMKNYIQNVNNHASIILNDLKNSNYYNQFFHKYKKEDVIKWLDNPSYHQDKLIEVSCYLYAVSNHYRRLIKYFSDIALLSYIIIPDEIDVNKKNIMKDYKKACRIIKNLNINHEFKKIFSTIFREDIAYCLMYKSEQYSSFFIKTLPYKYCKITYVKNGCYGISFDFSYFLSRENKLSLYGDYFINEYNKIKNAKDRNSMWVQIPTDIAFAIKWDESVDYALPPLVGVLTSLFDLEDYKKLKKVKEKIGNYKLLELIVPYENGQPLISLNVMRNFYEMILDSVPEDIGVVMTPQKMNEHTFERAGQTNADLVAEATNDFFSNAGVSQLLFSSDKSGNSIISASTEIDATYVYGIYRQIEKVLNMILKEEFNGKQQFRVQLLNINVFNKDKEIEKILKEGTYGFGSSISRLAAIENIDLYEVDALTELENNIFKFHEKFTPFSSSHTQNSNQTGRTPKNDDELSDEGQATRDRDESKNG